MAKSRVASWEDAFKTDKIAVSGLINQFYLQKSNLIGVNGMTTPDLLWRYIMINTEIEGIIGNYIEPENEYWTIVNQLKLSFIPEIVQMPQNSGMILKKLSIWNKLLSKEFMKLNMMLVRSRAARI